MRYDWHETIPEWKIQLWWRGGTQGNRGYEWKQHSSVGEIPPSAVQNLPDAIAADINNDGTPDIYWDNNLTMRRMDDNDRVDSRRYSDPGTGVALFIGLCARDKGRLGGLDSDALAQVIK